jgi:hypothetical protein
MIDGEIKYIDLFAGIGGFRYSFDKAGDNGGEYGHFGNDLYCPFIAPFTISTINLKKML